MSIDLDKPRYDQSTYIGRATHFLYLTNPMNAFASNSDLEEAKKIVTEFRRSRRMPAGYNEDKLWAAKYLYDSAFHPDSGEKMIVLGRMAAQAPMNTIITGCMITFYKTTAATVFWQWVNQTFNALVNYTNRSGDAPLPTSTLCVPWLVVVTATVLARQLVASYCAACSGALCTALYLNSKVKNMSPIYASLVPFAAVCGANFINIPMMRSGELLSGTPVFSADGTRLGVSQRAAKYGIGLVCVSRVLMALPGMTVTPLITSIAVRKGLFCRRPMMVIPFQLFLVGLCVTFATPLCCAIFDQRASMSVDSLDPELRDSLKKNYPKVKEVYFNKGL